ncbi:MAG: PDZ domain-containing protein, partial [Clostridia bacterium]|nr:PDZ domain-containing protein [Clostridia bacterium]
MVRVQSVEKDSLAAVAGVLPGDVITAINGQEVI